VHQILLHCVCIAAAWNCRHQKCLCVGLGPQTILFLFPKGSWEARARDGQAQYGSIGIPPMREVPTGSSYERGSYYGKGSYRFLLWERFLQVPPMREVPIMGKVPTGSSYGRGSYRFLL